MLIFEIFEIKSRTALDQIKEGSPVTLHEKNRFEYLRNACQSVIRSLFLTLDSGNMLGSKYMKFLLKFMVH